MAAKKKTTTKKKTTKRATGTKKVAKTRATKKVAAKAAPATKTRKLSKPKSALGAYTQSEFLENLQAFCGLEKKSHARELAGDIAELFTVSLKKGYKVPFFGLGKISVRKTKRRKGRNPATGEAITIPAKKKVKFTAAKALKEAVL